jgi:hypothetical protein
MGQSKRVRRRSDRGAQSLDELETRSIHSSPIARPCRSAHLGRGNGFLVPVAGNGLP